MPVWTVLGHPKVAPDPVLPEPIEIVDELEKNYFVQLKSAHLWSFHRRIAVFQVLSLQWRRSVWAGSSSGSVVAGMTNGGGRAVRSLYESWEWLSSGWHR